MRFRGGFVECEESDGGVQVSGWVEGLRTVFLGIVKVGTTRETTVLLVDDVGGLIP